MKVRMSIRRVVPILLAGLAVGASTQGCAMPPKCFSGRPDYLFPKPELVRPNLTHGEAGRRLYDALIDGDRTAVATMIAGDPRLAELTVNYDRRGDRPAGQDGDLLTLAVTNCDGEMLAALLRAGVSPQGVERGRALSWALLADEPDMAELLLRAGASPDPQKSGGLDVFRDMAAAGQLGGAMMLVRHGLDLQWVDQFGSGHLETAMNMESFAIAEELVRAGAPLWRVSMGGYMPVHALFRQRVLADPGENVIFERMRAKARRPGLPWPPPPPNEVLVKVLAGEWPTPAMREAGMVVPPATLAMLQQRARDYGQDGTAKP
jgi:hypothetical protein